VSEIAPVIRLPSFLWIRIAPFAVLALPQTPLGARRGGNPGGAVDMDSNASYAAEVERNVSRDNDFSLRGELH
jgi:hypothetical protein